MKSGWSFRRKYFVGDQSRTTTDRGEAERFRLLPRSTNGNLYDQDRPALAAAFRLYRRSTVVTFSTPGETQALPSPASLPLAGSAGGQSRVSPAASRGYRLVKRSQPLQAI